MYKNFLLTSATLAVSATIGVVTVMMGPEASSVPMDTSGRVGVGREPKYTGAHRQRKKELNPNLRNSTIDELLADALQVQTTTAKIADDTTAQDAHQTFAPRDYWNHPGEAEEARRRALADALGNRRGVVPRGGPLHSLILSRTY